MNKRLILSTKIIKDKYGNKNFLIDSDIMNMMKILNVSIFPHIKNNLTLRNDVHKADGVILFGGGNLYESEKTPENFIRDSIEQKLIKIFLKRNKPILGICRGYQQIMKYHKVNIKKKKGHVRTTHKLNITNSKYLKKGSISVNSYHNFIISKAPKEFEIISKHNDESIEIMEHKKKKILCLMFHPERKMKSQKKILSNLKKFFK